MKCPAKIIYRLHSAGKGIRKEVVIHDRIGSVVLRLRSLCQDLVINDFRTIGLHVKLNV